LLLGRVELRVEGLHALLHPRVEAGLVLVGDAQQLADHRDRERVGQVVDDIDPVSACEAVDQLVTIPSSSGSMPGDGGARTAPSNR
jgi:hypothetical protein